MMSTAVGAADHASGANRALDHPRRSKHLRLRIVPLAGTFAFVIIAVNYSIWWLPVVHHTDAWWVPGDFWHTYFATSAFAHGHWGAVYEARNGIITFPGLLVLLSPAVALAQALHLSVGMPYTPVSTPTAWLVLEPFDLLAGCCVLFSVDAVARRLDVLESRRAILAVAELVAMWDLLVNNWHPEDAFAVAFALWALLAAFDGRWRRCGWLLGVAIAFQPLVLLAVAAVAAIAPRKKAVSLVIRAVAPATTLLAGPLLSSPSITLRALIDQPSSPLLNHPTPWMHFAPHLGGGAVAGGPARSVAVIVAVTVSFVVCRRTDRPDVVLWIVAACLATRCFFEAVMVSYYIWPALAMALVLAARATWTRFVAVCVFSSFATIFALHNWRGEWTWWLVIVVCIAAALVAAYPQQRVTRHADKSKMQVSSRCR